MIETNMISQAENEKLDQIDRDCVDMHVIPPPRVYVELEVKDADGNVTQRHTERAKSWVRNFYNFLLMNMAGLDSDRGGSAFGAGTVAIKNTAGTTIASPQPAVQWYAYTTGMFEGPSGDDTYGIIVGTSDEAESFESRNLSAKITHGSSAGNLSYQSQSQGVVSYDSAEKIMSVTLSRVMNNNSPGVISVAETGLVAYVYVNSFLGLINMLMDRNVLSAAVDVPVGGQLTVNYVMTLTYPA